MPGTSQSPVAQWRRPGVDLAPPTLQGLMRDEGGVTEVCFPVAAAAAEMAFHRGRGRFGVHWGRKTQFRVHTVIPWATHRAERGHLLTKEAIDPQNLQVTITFSACALPAMSTSANCFVRLHAGLKSASCRFSPMPLCPPSLLTGVGQPQTGLCTHPLGPEGPHPSAWSC